MALRLIQNRVSVRLCMILIYLLNKHIHTWVWHTALGDELGEHDTKRPDIGFDGEFPIESCLWGRPLDGELRSCVTVTELPVLLRL